MKQPPVLARGAVRFVYMWRKCAAGGVLRVSATRLIVPRVNTSSVIATWLPISISLVSLVITLWFSVIRPSRQAKVANPLVQLDLQSYESRSGWHDDVQVILADAAYWSHQQIKATSVPYFFAVRVSSRP
jgi:hypothetical protein